MRRGVGRRLVAEPREQRAEAPAILGEVDRVDACAEDRHARILQPGGELQRRLAAELHDDALGLLDLHDAEHVVERQRLEVQAVGGVVVRRDGLGVAVDHHRVAPAGADGHRRVHAAVVELDALADAVRAGAEDDDARLVAAADLVAAGRPEALPAGVVVRRLGGELGRARVDGLVRPLAFERRLRIGGELRQLAQEPEVDLRAPLDLLGLGARRERREQHVVAVRTGHLQAREQLLHGARDGRDRVQLAAAHRLGERLLERAPDRHRLADGLHVRAQALVDAGELLEGEARPLHDDVVDRRLEGGRRAPRDVVVDLLQRVADGKPGGDLRDRKARRLGCQRRGPRDARVHLDDHDLLGRRVDRELDVRAPSLNPDRTDNRERLVTKLLIEAVGQRLLRGDRDAVAGVDAHRVDVLDRADDHAVVVVIAHDLELELAPADHRLVEQDLRDRRRLQAAAHDPAKLLRRAGDPAAAAAERVRRADDDRQADVDHRVVGLLRRRRDRRARHLQAGPLHRDAKLVAVLGAADRRVVRADELHAELLQRAVLVQRLGEVQRRLAAERRQQRVGALLRDDLAHRAGQQRLDVRRVGELRVGHDRRRVGVDEHDLVALLLEDLAGLHAGVVELGRLADDDRAGTEDEDALDVVPSRHGPRSDPGSDRRDRGCRSAPGRPRGGTGPCRRRRRAASDPRPCGHRG